MGGHYRHCLDHFTSLRRGLEAGLINYDRRDRDPEVETEPDVALRLTRDLRQWLERLPAAGFDRTLRVRCEVSYHEGRAPEMTSTFGRELAYGVAHAIHHYALMAIMARLMDVALPDTFGVAPSTVAHQRKGRTR